MKKFFLLFVMLFIIVVHAEDFDIDRAIEKIQQESDPKKRVEMMNQLKEKIAKMNAEQRAKTIAKLRSKRARPSYNVEQLHQQSEEFYQQNDTIETDELHETQESRDERESGRWH